MWSHSAKRNTTVKLFCAAVGVGSVFPVDIDISETVGDLKKEIKEQEEYGFPASKLQLYLAREGSDTWLNSRDDDIKALKKGEIPDRIKNLMREEMQMLEAWDLSDEEYFCKNFERAKGDIHVLVECPPEPDQVDLMPPIDEGWTAKWLSDFRKSQIASHNLPLVGELEEFIKHELPVKITLHERIRKNWISKMNTPSYELMDKIFRVANSEPCVEFLNQIGYRVVVSVDPGDTEYSFVSFWDDLICHVLNFVGIGKSDRNSSGSALTGPNRPDYLFIVDSVCVFRGEEKAPGEQIDTLRRELFDKLIWSYGDAPYLFGYAAVGYEARLYAITHAHDGVDAIELGVYDLKHLEGRFSLLLAILNVARLLRSLASLCPESARDEYKKIIRDQGIKVLLEPTHVVKCFPTALYQQAKDHVQVVYKVLEEHAIPNVDRLDHADHNAKRLVFKPRGREVRPANLLELFHALANVLQALVKLHAASWMHRDIRWANVIQNREDNSWFLIDFMDAAPSPQVSSSGNHLNREEHAPEIFASESHSTAVDIWSVGLLIGTCGSVHASWYDKGGERSQFEDLLLHPNPSQRPTAAAALEQLGHLEQQYLRQQKSSGRTRRQKQK